MWSKIEKFVGIRMFLIRFSKEQLIKQLQEQPKPKRYNICPVCWKETNADVYEHECGCEYSGPRIRKVDGFYYCIKCEMYGESQSPQTREQIIIHLNLHKEGQEICRGGGNVWGDTYCLKGRFAELGLPAYSNDDRLAYLQEEFQVLTQKVENLSGDLAANLSEVGAKILQDHLNQINERLEALKKALP